jgi:hypothetical protein
MGKSPILLEKEIPLVMAPIVVVRKSNPEISPQR